MLMDPPIFLFVEEQYIYYLSLGLAGLIGLGLSLLRPNVSGRARALVVSLGLAGIAQALGFLIEVGADVGVFRDGGIWWLFSILALLAVFIAPMILLKPLVDGEPVKFQSSAPTPNNSANASRPVQPSSPKPAHIERSERFSAEKPPDVFISYKREDRTAVQLISKQLEALKLTVWFDAELRSGESFDAEIDRMVRAAKCVLVCWSPSAVSSDWVRGEATIGRERGVLAAAILQDCDLPAPFNLVHAENLTAGIGPANNSWIRTLDRIGALINRPGLARFAELESSSDGEQIARWLSENNQDPLFDDMVARLKLIR